MMLGRERRHAWTGRVLVALCAILLMNGCRTTPDAETGRVDGVDVQRYELDLALDPETLELDGEATLTVQRTDSVSALPLTLSALTVESVTVDGVATEFDRRGETIEVPLPAGDGPVTVTVAYSGVPEEGLYAETYAGQRVVFTDSWPDRSAGWLPGIHHPSDPATFQMTLTVPRGSEAVATGALAQVDTLETGLAYRWALDAGAPTYAFAFAVADFSRTDLAARVPMPVYMLAPDSAEVSRLARTPQAFSYFEERIGRYPYAQYATVQVPIGYGGMENASAPFLRAGMFADGGNPEPTQVHELAHQWFGDAVVIDAWRDLWLSEGMATYLTTLFYEQADGLGVAQQRWANMAALGDGVDAGATTLVPEGAVNPNEHLTWIPYRKGGSVLHLLRRTLGDAAFFGAVQTAYANYQDQPLSTEDFKAILESTSGRDLDAFFDVWVYGDALPTLRTQWDAAAQTLSWTVEGDQGTLAEAPVLMEVTQGNQRRVVPVADGSVTLEGAEVPTVRPIGVMVDVQPRPNA